MKHPFHFDLQLFAEPPAGDPPKTDETPEGQIKALRAEAAQHRKERDELKAWRAEREAKDAQLEQQTAAEREAAERKKLADEKKYDELIAKEREDREKQREEFERKLQERDAAVAKERRRAIKLELISQAKDAGMYDPSDVTAFIRVNDLKEDEDGNIEGLSDKFAALKAAKPHLFKGDGSRDDSTRRSNGAPPGRASGDPPKRDYAALSDADFSKEMAAMGVRLT